MQPGREWEVKTGGGGGNGGGGRVKLKSKQDAVEQDAFCELSTHYWGFGNSTKMTALGTFLFLSLFLVNMFSKRVQYLCGSLGK